MSTSATTPIMTAETETIPAGHADVKEAAVRALYVHGFPGGDLPTGVMEQDILSMLAVAILAERERCAKVADDAAKRYRGTLPGFNGSIISNVGGSVAEDIAKSIRNPTP